MIDLRNPEELSFEEAFDIWEQEHDRRKSLWKNIEAAGPEEKEKLLVDEQIREMEFTVWIHKAVKHFQQESPRPAPDSPAIEKAGPTAPEKENKTPTLKERKLNAQKIRGVLRSWVKRIFPDPPLEKDQSTAIKPAIPFKKGPDPVQDYRINAPDLQEQIKRASQPPAPKKEPVEEPEEEIERETKELIHRPPVYTPDGSVEQEIEYQKPKKSLSERKAEKNQTPEDPNLTLAQRFGRAATRRKR